MLTITSFKELYNSDKENREVCCETLLEYFTIKFAETSKMFAKFDRTALTEFFNLSSYEEFEDGKAIFSKNAECSHYYFILFGDINLYEENSANASILIKTVPAGSLYGHKLKSVFNYFGIARNETHVMRIRKNQFDELLVTTNKRKENFKKIFLKKFFPKFRLYSDDIIDSMKSYFIREEYGKNLRVLIDGQFEENIYLIINGEFGIIKSNKKINLTNDEDDYSTGYVILEHLKRGEVFGIYSALKHQKNNYSVIVLSDKAEVYKISKSSCLFYFGGSLGMIPEALKGIDTVQQNSIENKIKLVYDNVASYTPEILAFERSNNEKKKEIDETEIENTIKDSWKELENLSSKVSDFKAQLFNKTKKEGVLNKLRKEDEIECNYY
jgi:CRP-like cAMP-binding protein